jgi:hypothetical protein
VPPIILGCFTKPRNPLNRVAYDGDIKLTCYPAPTVLKQKTLTMLERPDAVVGQFDVVAALRRHLAIPQTRDRRDGIKLTHYPGRRLIDDPSGKV